MNPKKRTTVTAFIILLCTFFLTNCQSRDKKAPSAEYGALLRTSQKTVTCSEGDKVEIVFHVHNTGKHILSSSDPYPCFLSYHLLDKDKRILQFDNHRFRLPEDLAPGKKTEIPATIFCPLESGCYFLEFDLVREGKNWFKDTGSSSFFVTLQVQQHTWPDEGQPLNLKYGKFSKIESEMSGINKISRLIRLTLDKNEVSWSGKTGKIHAFSPGTDYPQVWLRDAATILPVSRYFYGGAHLCSWLEEHLFFQEPNGSLQDWIDSRGLKDKNTTETDQESNAVLAAYQVFSLLGSDWLETSVGGEKIIDRLEKAMTYVLKARQDPRFGLIVGAHTADWGDVDMVDDDNRAVYTDERTHWTVDIYDQAMFFEASGRLAEMLESLNRMDKASYWFSQQKKIGMETNQLLWQPEKGFYRIHIHLDSLKHSFDESNIFAMGGNVQAILSGLSGKDRSIRIIQEALIRQNTYGFSTVSGTLLPPYPQGTFRHPLLDDPYEYQNGGQWDWFGGRLVYAMFDKGFSTIGKEKLLEIFNKILTNRSFFEWDTKAGTGRGSDTFAGGAGMVGKALFEGYFGIRWEKSSLSLRPCLGKDRGKVHLYFPANDIFVAYDYIYKEKKIIFRFNSNFSGNGMIRILAPASWPKEKGKVDIQAHLDGHRVSLRRERCHHDDFYILSSDFQNHILEIFLK
ncbi:MAG: hypothetical protein JXB26_18850 [Candidatus Aminicenantes bacterium]|nr:hypothetical protein [Candidatus Aminicenantes bacterium]